MKIKRMNHTSSQSYSSNKKVDIPSSSTPSITSSIKETIVAGFGLGVGSEIAHRAVSAVLGPRQIEIQHQKEDDKCSEYLSKYQKCLKEDSCIDELENYQKCLKSI